MLLRFRKISGGPAFVPVLLLQRVARFGWLVAVTLSGCATGGGTPVVEKALPASPIVSVQQVQLTPDELRSITSPEVGGPYVLGAGDVIGVTVYLHPELSTGSTSGLNYGGATDMNTDTTANGVNNVLITSDGTAQLPLIGTVHFGGHTLAEAQAELTRDYSKYIQDPKVSVNLISAQSMKYYLLGDFTQPGIKYPLHPLSLLQAMALGGSVDLATADLYQAYVAQGNVKLPIDINALLVNGDMSQNITLASGDVIMIPSSASENAFVFGSVTKPGAVLFNNGRLSLLQALAEAGSNLTTLTSATLSNVHIIRSDGAKAEYFVVNAEMIMNGEAASFSLRPGDIVFVPANAVARWNEVINQLLPSLQAVSSALSPFVSLKYLRQ